MPPENADDQALSFDFALFAVDRVGVGIFGIDRRGRFVFVNDAGCRSLGYAREELLGMGIPDIDPLFPEERWDAHWEEERRRGVMTFESVHRTHDGRTFPVEITTNYVEHEGTGYLCAVARDISERKRQETAIQHYALRLEKGRSLALGALEDRSPREISAEALEHMKALIAYDRASVMLVDTLQETVTLLCTATSWKSRSDVLAEGKSLPLSFFSFSRPLLAGHPWYIPDIARHPQPRAVDQELTREGFRSYMGVPLLIQGSLVGVLNFASRNPEAFSPDQRAAAEDFAPTLALAIRQARLREERQQAEEAVRRYARRLEKIREMEQAILASDSPERIAVMALTHLQGLLPCERGSILLLDREQTSGTLLAVASVQPTALRQGLQIPLAALFSDAEVASLTAGQVRLIPDLETVPHAPATMALLQQDGFRSLLNVPLHTGSPGELVGTLNFASQAKNAFSPEHVEMAQEVANTLAIHLRQARLREDQETASRALRFTQFAVDHAAVGMLWIGEEGQLLFGNEALRKALGYTAEELRGLSIGDIDPNFPRERWHQSWEEARRRRQVALRSRHRRKNGSEFPVEIHGNYLEYLGEGHIFVVVQDISENLRAEEALRASERTARALLDATTDAVLLVDARGTVEAVNVPFTLRLGLAAEDLVGHLMREHLTPELAASREAFLEQVVRTGKPVRFEDLRDGLFLENSMYPVQDEEGRVTRVALFSRDISKRKRVEIALKESEERHRLLFEKSLDAMLLMEGDRFVDCNDSAVRMLGLRTKDQLLGKKPWDISPDLQPDGRSSREKGEGLIADILRQGGARFEWIHRRADGSEFPADVVLTPISSGNRRLSHITWRDMSAQKAIEEKLRRYALRVERLHAVDKAMLANDAPESIARDVLHHLRNVIACHRSSIVLFDAETATGTVLATEVDGETHLGSGSRLPLSAFRLIHRAPGDGDAVVVPDLGMVAPRLEAEDAVYRDGIRTYVSVPILCGSQLIGALNFSSRHPHIFTEEHVAIAGEVATSLALAIERARLRQDREHLLEELSRKNKELESIIYVTSHDLRSPLVNIQGFGQRLEKGCTELLHRMDRPDTPENLRRDLAPLLEERIPSALRFIRTSGEKMDSLIGGLLRLSRTGRVQLRPENLDMDRLLRAVVDSQTWQIQKLGATVHLAPLPPCRGDEGQMNQLFSNLLDNALKYHDPQRPLTVSISGYRDEERRESVYALADTGLGIPVEHQEKVWGLFSRLDPAGSVPGEGLGLTLTKRIVERHGGRIWLTSEPGKGTTFFVALPPPAEASQWPSPHDGPSA